MYLQTERKFSLNVGFVSFTTATSLMVPYELYKNYILYKYMYNTEHLSS
jgi:hypothetical protein